MHDAPALPICPVKVSTATIENVSFGSKILNKDKIIHILLIEILAANCFKSFIILFIPMIITKKIKKILLYFKINYLNIKPCNLYML